MSKAESQHYRRIQVSRAQCFIRDRFKESMNLEEIAKEAGSSKYHFIRIFSAYLGETPFEYIRRLRIIEAAQQLKLERSVTDIAIEVGFDSSSAFNKAFKKLLNINPTEFRNLGKEEKRKSFILYF